MGEAGRSGRILLVGLVLATAACRDSQVNSRASVTVPLPPARPAAPKPSFSFGGTPNTVSEEDSSTIR